MTFEDLAKAGAEELAKQPPITYKQALAQVKWLKENSTTRQVRKGHKKVNDSEEKPAEF